MKTAEIETVYVCKRSKGQVCLCYTETHIQLVKQDTRFEDVYWQTNVEDKYSRKHQQREHWVLRAIAETNHGGGAQGREAVQAAVDVGYYLSRKIKSKGPKGEPLELEEICVRDHMKEQTYEESFGRKIRAGGKAANGHTN